MKQFRIAETEKYAHVTFFLNGGREKPFSGEDRILVPSPQVATYDHQPEMSAFEVTERLEEGNRIRQIRSDRRELCQCRHGRAYGHFRRGEKAIDAIDICLGRLRAAVGKSGGVLLVTADHGNAEMMRDPETGEPHTAHTTFDVPLIVVGAKEPLRLSQGPARRCCADTARSHGHREAA